jgi:GNAT superfamily N-acetyltransferase
MIIQPLESTDLDSVKQLQPADWSDILPVHQYYLTSSFCYPIKIVIDEKIVGIGTAIIHPDVAWLAHIIVNPDYRNKGIGKFITQKLIDIAKANNKETIYLLATDIGAPVYAKLGFETETEYQFYRGGNLDPNWDTIPNIYPFKEQYKAQIIPLDALTCGENRAMRLEEHFSGSFVYMVNDIVEGYFMPGFSEGLIIANNPEAGIALMKLRLRENEIAILPRDNKQGIAFLEHHGFSTYRKAQRMRLGKERTWQPCNIYNRVSGQLG